MFFDLLPCLPRTLSGTALQERARIISRENETIRSLLIENTMEDRVTFAEQKTITNADVIALDHLFKGELASVCSLILKIDAAEMSSDPQKLLRNP